MIGGNLNTTKNQYMASLLLKEDERPEHPEQGRRKHLGYLHKTNQKDSGSEEDIQEQNLLELVTSTFPQEDNTDLRIGLRQFVFMLNAHREYIDAGPASLRVVNVSSASGWVYPPSLWGTESPTTDAGSRHADLSARVHPQTHGVLGQFASIVQWDNNRFYRLPSSRAESPTTSADLERPDKSVVLNEIFGQLDTVFRWSENWDDEDPESEKPSEHAIDRAKQVVGEFLGAVNLAGHTCHAPVISYDQEGYINMVWRNGKHELYLDMTEDDIEYTKIWGINIDSEMDIGVLNRDNYLTLWEWLFNERK